MKDPYIDTFVTPDDVIRRVAIFEGEEFERMIPYWLAEIAGYSTIHVPQTLCTIEEIIQFVRAHADALISLHRLNRPESQRFAFYGAELVAACYDAKIPALLVTQYSTIDENSWIRQWRDKVPIVFHLRELDVSNIREKFELCLAELQGHFPVTRVPYRVLVGVVNVEDVSGESYVDATVDVWDHYHILRFPLTLIPENLHDRVLPGAWFFVHVNVKAEYPQDLYFREFELAPEPEYEENLTYCVNVLDGTGNSEFGEEDALRFFNTL